MALLDGHPELVVFNNESHFFLKFLPAYKGSDSQTAMALGQEILLENWHPDNYYYRKFLAHIPYAEVIRLYQSWLKQPDREQYPHDYLTSAVLAYGKASGQFQNTSRYWVEKTPYNEQYARLIFEWWPQAKCLHMLRDPRDFWATLKNRAIKRQRKMPKLEATAYSWQESVQLAYQNQRLYGTKQYLILCYEDLVKEPRQELDKIIDFLEIDDFEGLLQPTKGGGHVPWQGNAVSQKFNSISAANIGRWRQELDETEVCVLESLVSFAMQQAGYERTTEETWRTQLHIFPLRVSNLLRYYRDRWHRIRI